MNAFKNGKKNWKFTSIFAKTTENNKTLGGDKKRITMAHNFSFTNDIEKLLNKNLGTIDDPYILINSTLLCSLIGCHIQIFHSDFTD